MPSDITFDVAPVRHIVDLAAAARHLLSLICG